MRWLPVAVIVGAVAVVSVAAIVVGCEPEVRVVEAPRAQTRVVVPTALVKELLDHRQALERLEAQLPRHLELEPATITPVEVERGPRGPDGLILRAPPAPRP